VKLIGVLPGLSWLRAETHWALSQMVAPLGTESGKRICDLARLDEP
jgi:hypothetical protein